MSKIDTHISAVSEALSRFSQDEDFSHFTLRHLDVKGKRDRVGSMSELCDEIRMLGPGKYRAEAVKEGGTVYPRGTKQFTIVVRSRTTSDSTHMLIETNRALRAITERTQQNNQQLHELLLRTTEALLKTNADLHEAATSAQIAAVEALNEQPNRIDMNEVLALAMTL